MDNYTVEKLLEEKLAEIGMPLGPRITRQTILEIGDRKNSLEPLEETKIDMESLLKNNPSLSHDEIKGYLQELYED